MWMDPVQQRRISIYIFLSIQLIKLSSIIQSILENSTPNHFILWSALDILYLVGLKYMRIPCMTLTISGTIIMIIAFCTVNAGIIAGLSRLFLIPELPLQPHLLPGNYFLILFKIIRYFKSKWLFNGITYNSCTTSYYCKAQSEWIPLLSIRSILNSYFHSRKSSFFIKLWNYYSHWNCCSRKCYHFWIWIFQFSYLFFKSNWTWFISTHKYSWI